MKDTAPMRIGPYAAQDFRVCTGAEAGDALDPAARFLFRDETIALPVRGPMAGCDAGAGAFDDLRAWSADPGPLASPPLVWIAAPQRLTGLRIAADGRSLEADGTRRPLDLAPKIPLNRSWVSGATFDYLSRRPVTARGETMPSGAFVARTFWPEDWRLDESLPHEPLHATGDPAAAVRRLLRDPPRGGADAPFAARLFWERTEGRLPWAGLPVIGFVLNGAQGDDDEAWGGHFALATGRLPADGRLSDLLVANFYALDVESEKGILAAPVPLDNYLGDLNSGQAWYRPSYLALAILKDPRAADLVQGAMNRLYRHFWPRRLAYRHSTMNCSAICVDALRALGWPVPARGAANTRLAWLSMPAMAWREGRLAAARNAYEYFTEDRTRLMPAAAFEETCAGLLRLASHGPSPGDGRLARWLAEDLSAIVGIRLPQIPSSRAYGTWPVANPREYLDAIPRDPAQAQIVPVPPRAFPPELDRPARLGKRWRRSTLPLLAWSATGVLPAALLAGWLRRRWRERRG